MNIAISGTYCTGKTTTSIALAHLTGIPRTHARTMRQILPEAVPGKRLEECSIAELVQLGVRRYAERAVHEALLPSGFISDGSSLHEWVYGTIRVLVGIHPDDCTAMPVTVSPDIKVFEEVMENIGSVMKQHAKKTYDVFVHLPVEFALVEDGHRPVSERFRQLSDQLLRSTLEELEIPYHVVSGGIEQRLATITRLFGLQCRMPVPEAIGWAVDEMASLATPSEVPS